MGQTNRLANPSPSPIAVFVAIGGVYISQSVISGLTFTSLPAILRTNGLPLDQIGLIYLAILPWSLKFLWSPYLERFRLPARGKNRSAQIILTGGLLSASCLLLAGQIGPQQLTPLLLCLTLVAFVAATIDIACDGYTVEALAQRDYGWGNAIQVGSAYLGAAIGSGLFLVIYDHYGWNLSLALMAAMVLLLAIPFVLQKNVHQPAVERQHIPSLRLALQRTEIRKGLVLTACFVAAQKWGGVMMEPYMIDAKIGLSLLGILNGAGGLITGLAGACIGGLAVRYSGTRPVLLTALVLQCLLMISFIWFSGQSNPPRFFMLLCALASSFGVMAFGFVALYARFMEISDIRQAGVDFTIFQCMDGVISMIGGVVGGKIAALYGYQPLFAVGAGLSAAAMPLIWSMERFETGR
ncbi:MFS transporter [Brucella gallinifaecis]|uniref:MFS transporter n=1 Tax=Brucella gallinifaecis TaxID=215590 RepID=A0A502BMT6_9HYPH|nr:MFS transporter [Brucella gallinifaecis]TPF75455.1 MFS transporter [Brucella gallinifaecis]